MVESWKREYWTLATGGKGQNLAPWKIGNLTAEGNRDENLLEGLHMVVPEVSNPIFAKQSWTCTQKTGGGKKSQIISWQCDLFFSLLYFSSVGLTVVVVPCNEYVLCL